MSHSDGCELPRLRRWSIHRADRIDRDLRKEPWRSRYSSQYRCAATTARRGACIPPALPLRLPAECKADTGDKAGLFVNTPKGPEGGEGRDVGDKMQDHLFFFFFLFLSLFLCCLHSWWRLIFIKPRRSLDSCRRKWPRSPSSLMPVDSQVAAGQAIMKWPWSPCQRGAMMLLKHQCPKVSNFPSVGQHLFAREQSPARRQRGPPWLSAPAPALIEGEASMGDVLEGPQVIKQQVL